MTSTMKTLLSVFAVIAIISAAIAGKVRYDNYQVFSVTIDNEKNLETLHEFQNQQGVIFWEPAVKVKTSINVAVPPHQVDTFNQIMIEEKVHFQLMIDNVQELIDNENPKRSGKAEGDFDWTSYHNAEEIYAWLDGMAARFPDIVTITDIGQTYEGRKMKVVKISFQEVKINKIDKNIIYLCSS